MIYIIIFEKYVSYNLTVLGVRLMIELSQKFNLMLVINNRLNIIYMHILVGTNFTPLHTINLYPKKSYI